MKTSLLQAILSILVVSAFLIVTTVVALVPILGGYPPDTYTEHLKTFASLYSGVVGIVVGYYFGRNKGKAE
ncbi:MAG TPA: hypothetical protein PKO15_17675 [Fibrobacteria bacterium]|nr:hypothetical protein [Fibrobacteria bacterium]HOX53449.1 hypothetical protein [Fibrobacteria bacterium]